MRLKTSSDEADARTYLDLPRQDGLRCHECGGRLFRRVLHSRDGFGVKGAWHGIYITLSFSLSPSLQLSMQPPVSSSSTSSPLTPPPPSRPSPSAAATSSSAPPSSPYPPASTAAPSPPSSPAGASPGGTSSPTASCAGSARKKA